MTPPTISVVIPVYNPGPRLEAALASVFAQDLGADTVECLAVDDCSPDGSGAVLARWAAGEPRLRHLSFPENRGAGPARNAGLDAATGEYVCFLDPDDVYPPGALRALLEAVRQSDLPMARGNILEFEREDLARPRDSNMDRPGDRRFADTPVLWTPWMHQQFLFRRGFLREHDVRYPALRRGQDTVMLARALARCEAVACIDTVVYHYTVQVKSGRWGAAQFDNILDHFFLVREAYLAAGHRIPWCNYLNAFWNFWRHLQNGASANLSDAQARAFLEKAAPLFREADEAFFAPETHRCFPLEPWRLLVYRLLQGRQFDLLLALLRSRVRLDVLLRPAGQAATPGPAGLGALLDAVEGTLADLEKLL